MAASKKTRSTSPRNAADKPAMLTQGQLQSILGLLEMAQKAKTQANDDDDDDGMTREERKAFAGLTRALGKKKAKNADAVTALVTNLGDKNLRALARGVKKAKTADDVHEAFRKASSRTQTRLLDNDIIEGKRRRDANLTQGDLWWMAALAALGIGGAVYVGHRMGHKRGMMDLAEASLDALGSSPSDFRLSSGSDSNSSSGGSSVRGLRLVA